MLIITNHENFYMSCCNHIKRVPFDLLYFYLWHKPFSMSTFPLHYLLPSVFVTIFPIPIHMRNNLRVSTLYLEKKSMFWWRCRSSDFSYCECCTCLFAHQFKQNKFPMTDFVGTLSLHPRKMFWLVKQAMVFCFVFFSLWNKNMKWQ